MNGSIPSVLRRKEQSWQGTVLSRRDFGQWRVLASAGIFTGYRDLSSAWLDEYYRQQWKDIPIPGDRYEEPDPWGYTIGGGLRYEYLPASGWVQLDLGFQQETVAPGYEADFDEVLQAFALNRGQTNIETWSATITLENIPTAWLRTQQQLVVSSTTDRTERYAVQSSGNLSLHERLVFRGVGAYALEGGDFHSWSAGGTFIYALSDHWSASLSNPY